MQQLEYTSIDLLLEKILRELSRHDCRATYTRFFGKLFEITITCEDDPDYFIFVKRQAR